MTVTTRHVSEEVGSKLVYDHNGKLVSKTPMSRQVGTTISLQGLFSTLPVRHKEFHRNIKKEFNKMVQILYSYCLMSTRVRISCTNQTDRGKKSVIVSTGGHLTVKENISSIFGAKQVSSLLEFRQETASDDVLAEYGMELSCRLTQENTLFTLEGYVSSCSHGQGRSAADRQFYFINSRPCDPARVMKVVNEVYHHYNRHQSPCVVLNIRLKQDDVDINVTPDKRQILVNNEKILLATIKTSLIRLYENIPSTYNLQNTSLNSPLNNSLNSSFCSPSPSVVSRTVTPGAGTGKFSALSQRFGRNCVGSSPPASSPVSISGLKRSLSSTNSPTNKQPKLISFLRKSTSSDPSGTSGTVEDSSDSLLGDLSMDGIQPLSSQSVSEIKTDETLEDATKITQDLEEPQIDSTCIQDCINSVDVNMNCDMFKTSEAAVGNVDSSDTQDLNDFSDDVVGENHCSSKADTQRYNSSTSSELEKSDSKVNSYPPLTDKGSKENGLKNTFAKFYRSASLPTSSSSRKAHSATDKFLNNLLVKKTVTQVMKTLKNDLTNGHTGGDFKTEFSQDNEDNDLEIVCEGSDVMDKEDSETHKNEYNGNICRKVVLCEDYDASDFVDKRKSKKVYFNLETIKQRLKSLQIKDKHTDVFRKFRATISPTENSAAEDELRKQISKDMFAEMEILGQFNLGFIIGRLGSDLFIIDQHATDEKYNFETLQQTCILQNQRLIIPQTLELTAVNESILLDNIEIFRKNGFEFKVDEEKPVGRRVSLVSMPFSRGWEFGREDIEELIFMLSDAPGVMCRPSRVRAMFASRACRKSVMIGTALTQAQMQKLVCHMGEIEQPWNCPHGRPTMRHLINLDMVTPPR
ncbi:mismatch repair endonuclease PMS2-like isoform X2 [Homarus americanus]|nr:mismatch repair endonuclease PMS2-like isoform X2 [Homarus americanus]XP_042235702.1 mismatch repair endonuclease PMS2-like isoform X2 [Homarus americanus]